MTTIMGADGVELVAQTSTGFCVWCGDVAYTTDDEGRPAHVCCAREQDADCSACRASRAAAKGSAYRARTTRAERMVEAHVSGRSRKR